METSDQFIYRLPHNSKTLILGKSMSGKTRLTHKLVETSIINNDFDIIIVFASEPDFSMNYKGYLPFWHKEMKWEHVKRYVDKQAEIVKRRREEGKEPPHLLIILDDAVKYSDDFYHNHKKEWTDLFSTCRHINISIVIILQSIAATLPPALKDQLTRIYLFNVPGNVNNLLDYLPPVVVNGKHLKGTKFTVWYSQHVQEKGSFILFDYEYKLRIITAKLPDLIQPLRIEYILY